MNGKQEVTNFLLHKLIATIGLILMGISLFLPWLSATSLFGINVLATGFDLSNEISILAIFFLIIGTIIIWLRNKHRQNGFICMGMAILMGLETYVLYGELQNRVESVGTNLVIARIGSGFYLLAVGVLFTFVGGVLLATIEQNRITNDNRDFYEAEIEQ